MILIASFSLVVVPGRFIADVQSEGTTKSAPVVLFFGDSYESGVGADVEADRWTSLVSAELGWEEVNEAIGGTGYVTAYDCFFDPCPSYLEVLEAVEASPDLVIFSGGTNDGPQPNYQATVQQTLEAAKRKWPKAKLIVTSPIWENDDPPSWLPTMIAAVKAAAKAAGARYLELGTPLAGHPEWITDDEVHPTSQGYRAIADAFLKAWRAK